MSNGFRERVKQKRPTKKKGRRNPLYGKRLPELRISDEHLQAARLLNLVVQVAYGPAGA